MQVTPVLSIKEHYHITDEIWDLPDVSGPVVTTLYHITDEN